MENKKKLFIKDILDIDNGIEIRDYFLVKEYLVLENKFGKEYLNLTLADNTGDISAKKWDAEKGDIIILEDNQIIKIIAEKDEYNNKAQVIIKRLRSVSNEDEINLQDFIKTAPEDTEDMFAFLIKKANEIDEPILQKITLEFLNENKEKLLYFPAAKSNHHAYLGGLLYHMKRMLLMAEKYMEVYEGLDKSLLFTGVILHDVGKLWELDSDKNGVVKTYTIEGNMLAHIVIGIKEFEKKADKYKLSEELKMMIEHMILSHHNEPEFGSPVKPAFLEAELLHHLDVTDSKLNTITESLENVKEGELTDRIYSLEKRNLYKNHKHNEISGK